MRDPDDRAASVAEVQPKPACNLVAGKIQIDSLKSRFDSLKS